MNKPATAKVGARIGISQAPRAMEVAPAASRMIARTRIRSRQGLRQPPPKPPPPEGGMRPRRIGGKRGGGTRLGVSSGRGCKGWVIAFRCALPNGSRLSCGRKARRRKAVEPLIEKAGQRDNTTLPYL